MKYDDSAIELELKRDWPHVKMRPDRDVEELRTWCRTHNSEGRYFSRRHAEKEPSGPWLWDTMWYFEFQEDAVLFSLKFV